jgi:hypothetical protein
MNNATIALLNAAPQLVQNAQTPEDRLHVMIETVDLARRLENTIERRTSPQEVAAAEWLVKLLGENGPTAAGKCVDLAKAAGFPKATLHRARVTLIESGKVAEGQRGDPWQLNR